MQCERMTLNWTNEETLKFIEIYGSDIIQNQLASSRMKREAYMRIVMEMANCGYSRSVDQLIRKMKKLRFDYKKARTKKGESKKEWIYFDAMDSLLSRRIVPHRDPPPLQVPSNLLRRFVVEHEGEVAREEVEGEENVGFDDGVIVNHGVASEGKRVQSNYNLDNGVESEEDLDSRVERVENLYNREVSRSRSETPSETVESVEDVRSVRKRGRDNESDVTEFLVDKMMKMQESNEKQFFMLAEKQMASDERCRKENQEFQLHLVSLLCNSQSLATRHSGSFCCPHYQCDRYVFNTAAHQHIIPILPSFILP